MKAKFSTTSTKTLGPVSARFINELLHRGTTLFTLDNASNLYGKDRHTTGRFLSKLIKRGILARIKSGTYLILQPGQENIQLSNWPFIARELASPDNYYISHYSAMRIHGMTTHALAEVFVTMMIRRRTKKINNTVYHFIYSKPDHFWGSNIHWITRQEKVAVSDIERTLLDGLERPDLCGGIKEVIRGISVKQKEINWNKMLEYAAKFHTQSAVKRLGYILEMLGVGINQFPLLLEIVAPGKDYILLDPNGLKKGKRVSRWRVQVNMNIEELKASIWE